MKKIILIFISFICLNAIGQITIDGSKIGQIDYKIIEVTDTLPSGITITPAGSNQTWNYTTFNTHLTETSVWQYPNWTPYASNFPNANLALKKGANYWYYNKGVSEVLIEGAMGDIFDLGTPVLFKLNPAQKIAELPITYQNSYVDTSASKILGDTSLTSLIPLLSGIFDSVRIELSVSSDVNVDSWGDLTTPLGTFEALRIKSTSYIETVIFGGTVIPFVGTTWIKISTLNDTTNQYSWWSDSLGFALLTINTNQNDVVEEATYLKEVPSPSSIVSISGSNFRIYPNPSSGIVNFSGFENNETIQIRNLLGQTVINEKVQNQSKDLTNLRRGLFLYDILDYNHNVIHSGKLLLE